MSSFVKIGDGEFLNLAAVSLVRWDEGGIRVWYAGSPAEGRLLKDPLAKMVREALPKDALPAISPARPGTTVLISDKKRARGG